jgi:hypothetical protein
MPKEGAMAQISRPFQLVIAAFALFVAVWFLALHRPGSSSSTGTSAGSGASASTHSHATAAATTGHARPAVHRAAYARAHGSASRTATHQVPVHSAASAHGARAHKQAATVVAAHTGHTGAHRPASHAVAPAAAAAGTAAAAAHAAGHAARSAPRAHTDPAAPARSKSSTPPLQATVAAELKHGKIVLLLFWNPHSSTDGSVYGQVQDVAHKLGHRVAVHAASAGQVGEFGTITRDIQVYQTPTLLIVNPHDKVSTVTGFTDAYAIEQTIREAHG